jgi:hypothetical protein
VAEVVKRYPVNRSFLYESGEQLGIIHRPPNSKRVVVIEAALREYLEGGLRRR